MLHFSEGKKGLPNSYNMVYIYKGLTPSSTKRKVRAQKPRENIK